MNPNSIWQPQQPRVHNQLDFDIGDPSLYHSVIYSYSQGHRVLVIAGHKQLDDPEVAFYMGFEGVWYFQGPTSWDGIDFELSDINERKSLLREGFLKIDENMMDAFAQQYILFMLQKPTFKIRILAGMCVILKTIPS
ncbi:MAG: hypothetical protein JW730_10080 [Anaerolineales bacterium]|nr:hypothetical protein [Anaerolineales bacterium]